MTHKDAGRYAAKHTDRSIDDRLAFRLKQSTSENKISCTMAHKIAKELCISPSDVGTAIDLLEIKINRCQLGLFGHGKQREHAGVNAKKISEIKQAVEAGLIKGRLSCAEAWKIAEKFKLTKEEIAAICESIKVKIDSCQLGVFK